MICSFRDELTEAVFSGEAPKGFPANLLAATRRKLTMLNAAAALADLRIPPGNRLHQLTGDREGQWSISVNDQYRICFKWGQNGPEEVEFTDYH